jgi:NAD(P)H-dependent FMN reductase
LIRIGIIIESTRPGRKGEAVAKWVYEIAQERSDAEFELVDIRDFNVAPRHRLVAVAAEFAERVRRN